ncbi:MAG: D-glycerate dehydrogenase [Ignavibacteriaceae bacterium]|nr:D-glycerate dehydrogenase [Ignavibacteriaceae bacterium]
MEIFFTREIPAIAEILLKKHLFKVKVYKKNNSIPKDILIKNIRNADGLISLLSDKIDKNLIDAMPKCRIIANYAVGYNNIDLDYARSKGIIVTNTPDVLTESTADITLALTLACARRLPEGQKIMKTNKFKGWGPKLLLGIELSGKYFGIIGAGRIGTAVAIRAKAFGTKILYCSNHKNDFLESVTGAKKVPLAKLLSLSDIISLHLPLTPKSYHLLNKDNLKLLKPNAILINTARGEIVDEKELIKLLKNNKIFAAGFDVYENEPNINPDLLKLKNVVLLPHVGSATFEARNKMAELAAQNVIAVLSGRKAITPV